MNALKTISPTLAVLLLTACVSRADRAENLATGAFAGGNYSKSFRAAQVLMAEEPDNPLGYIIAGDSLVELKRYEQAAPYYEELLRVLARRPDPADVAGEVLATEFKLERVRQGRGWTRPELVDGIERRFRRRSVETLNPEGDSRPGQAAP